ncbi:hypothetical protein O181_059836 [Austropuccinia psidii MF-1]|uniref:Uncharacterized protein n=1 Tax=Austropuccinia psidii MF-1 TaxID=1389203 RepID=A0A9Q3HW15_9BASI|nr:hypothetical protein [Austropuccinia psidii MF-1]
MNLFSLSYQAGSPINCNLGYTALPRSSFSICASSYGKSSKRYECTVNSCTIPAFSICFTDPGLSESPNWPPPGGVPVANPKIKSFSLTSDTNYAIAYNGPFPLRQTSTGQPTRYLCQTKSGAAPSCKFCW